MKAVLVHLPDVPWHCLTQDKAAPLLPTFLKLIEGGTSGLCAPVGPHPVMDGVVMTGAMPHQSGLLTRTEARPDGFGTDLMSATQLSVPTVWQYLDAMKHRCAVVNMRATNFGHLNSGIIVSDAFCEIRARNFDNWGIPPGAVTPLRMAKELADFRVHPEDLDASQIALFLAHETADDRDTKVRVVAKILAENSTAHAAATFLLENETLDFCAVRYPALAQLRNDFASPMRCQAGEGVAWGFLRLLDAFLARLIELAGENTVFFVTGGTEADPFWIAYGPGVAADLLWPKKTTLYDVAPSLLCLFGIKAAEMPGGQPPEILANQPLLALSASSVIGRDPVSAPDRLLIEGFAAGGLQKTQPSKAQHEMLNLHRFRTRFALAEIARLDRRHPEAIDAYIESLDIVPDDPTALLRLCGCLVNVSRTAEARTYFERLLATGASGVEVLITDAEIALEEGQQLSYVHGIVSKRLRHGGTGTEQKGRIRMLNEKLAKRLAERQAVNGPPRVIDTVR